MEKQKTFTQIRISLKEVQWRWIFGATFAVFGVTQIVMFFLISINVARSSAAGNTLSQEEILLLSDTLGIWVGPFVFLSLTFLAALLLDLTILFLPADCDCSVLETELQTGADCSHDIEHALWSTHSDNGAWITT